MTDENVRALRRAGAAEVWLGAESGSQRILDEMEKGISVEQTRAAVTRLRSQGVRVGLFLQFGYAGEGWSDVQATRALVRELLPDDIGVSVSYPLPGTRYHERMAARLGREAQLDREQRSRPAGAGSVLAPGSTGRSRASCTPSCGCCAARARSATLLREPFGARSGGCVARPGCATRGRGCSVACGSRPSAESRIDIGRGGP